METFFLPILYSLIISFLLCVVVAVVPPWGGEEILSNANFLESMNAAMICNAQNTHIPFFLLSLYVYSDSFCTCVIASYWRERERERGCILRSNLV